jgi:hypothetical protein
MTKATKSFNRPGASVHQASVCAGEPTSNWPLIPLPGEGESMPAGPRAGPGTATRLVPWEDVLPRTPLVCPVCGAPAEPVHALDTRATRGWRCQVTRSLHFWQWRTMAIRKWMAGQQYAIPPAPSIGGISAYPGVTFDEMQGARREMEVDRARWAAEGYDPNG